MSVSNKEVAERLKAVRELSDYSVEEFCGLINIDKESYTQYESGEGQIPISLLYDVSNALNVEITELLTGDRAKLHVCSLVKRGKGVVVERNEAYHYESLAHNFAGRKIEPFLVIIPPSGDDEPFFANSHLGHEYHYCLEGSYKIRIEEREMTLTPGDSLYFDSTYPHAMKGQGGQDAKVLVVVI